MSTIRQTEVQPEFDPDNETYTVEYNTDGTWEVTTTLVLALSSLTGEDPTKMRPLNRVVDPDVINRHVNRENPDNEISFGFHGHRVTVRSDGEIRFTPLEDQRREVGN